MTIGITVAGIVTVSVLKKALAILSLPEPENSTVR